MCIHMIEPYIEPTYTQWSVYQYEAVILGHNYHPRVWCRACDSRRDKRSWSVEEVFIASSINETVIGHQTIPTKAIICIYIYLFIYVL